MTYIFERNKKRILIRSVRRDFGHKVCRVILNICHAVNSSLRCARTFVDYTGVIIFVELVVRLPWTRQSSLAKYLVSTVVLIACEMKKPYTISNDIYKLYIDTIKISFRSKYTKTNCERLLAYQQFC